MHPQRHLQMVNIADANKRHKQVPFHIHSTRYKKLTFCTLLYICATDPSTIISYKSVRSYCDHGTIVLHSIV